MQKAKDNYLSLCEFEYQDALKLLEVWGIDYKLHQ